MPFIEVVANSTKLEKPGWAYVPDTGYDPTKAPVQKPQSRKRKARIQEPTGAGLSARQSTALAKRLAELDKENSRDIAIPVPAKADGKRSKPKTTATKKIFESQRTFIHYLDEDEAANRNANEAAQAKAKSRAAGKNASGMPPPALKRADTTVPDTPNVTTATSTQTRPISKVKTLEEAEARLMQVVVPVAPSQRLMDALTSAPPLTWAEARAKPSSSGLPPRYFCEICGYWGRVKCLQCGARVCGLNCKRTHDDSRCMKYGS